MTKLCDSILYHITILIFLSIQSYAVAETGTDYEWSDIDSTIYENLISNEENIRETGYLIYNETQSIYWNNENHGYEVILEIYGNGNILYTQRDIYVDPETEPLMVTKMTKSYVMDEYETVKEIFNNLKEKDFMDDESMAEKICSKHFGKIHYFGVYISNYREIVTWVDELSEGTEERLQIVELADNIISMVIEDGYEVSIEELIDKKEAYSEIYPVDEKSTIEILEKWIE